MGTDEWSVPARMLSALIGVTLFVVLWSVLASTIFLAGTRMLMAHKGVPLLDFWTYERFYGFANPVVGKWLKISAAVATAVPALMFALRVARSGLPGTKPRKLHGGTRWATRRELARAGLYAKFSGLFVGKDMSGRYLRFGGPEHVACYAPTRSGKGVGLVIPNCLLYEASLVCLDVKKENWAATAGIRAAAGQKVFLFDPLAPDGRTARYNPLSYVRRGTIDAFEDVQRIAQMVFPHVGGDQAFWTDSARSAFTGAAGFLAETPELPLTFGEILRLLSSADGAASMLERIEARRQAGNPYTEATVKALEDYLRGSADLVNSIRKTITSRLSLWFNPRIDAATATSDFDLRELRSSLHAIYIGVTPDNIARLRPLLALFFQQLVDLTIRTLPQFDPSAKHQVLLLLDEFPLLGPMPVLADAFAFVAGYNMRIMLIMQSKAQLRDRDLYGPDKAQAILDNCGLEVVFGTKDLKLTEELSARLGYDTVEASSRSGPEFWARVQAREAEHHRKRPKARAPAAARNRAVEGCRRDHHPPGLIPGAREAHSPLPGSHLHAAAAQGRQWSKPIKIDIRLDKGRGFEPIAAEAGAPATTSAPPAAVTDATPTPLPSSGPPDVVIAPLPRSSKVQADEDGEASKPQKSQSARPPRSRKAVVAEPTDELPVPQPRPLRPHQSDALLRSIYGADVDLSNFELADSKAAVAAIIDAVPTVESLNRNAGRSRAAA